MKRREETHRRLRELAILVGDVFHLDDHLQRHVLLSHRQHFHRLRRTANDGLHLRLAENVQNSVCTESLVRGNKREVVGVTGLFSNAPLQSVARENAQTLVLHSLRNRKTYSVVLWNEVQFDQTRGKVLNALPDFVIGKPHIIASFSFCILSITLMRESIQSGDIHNKDRSGKCSFHA